MKKQIILGTEGTQPFKISSNGVSHRHARIEIDEYGNLTLEDLNSTNGTFIRDGNGEMRRIHTMAITPMTLICLGPNNSNGCTFYARHAIAPQDNFAKEFEYLNELEDKFDLEDAKTDSRAKTVRIVIAIASVTAIVGSFITKKGSELQLLLLRLGSVVSLLSSVIYNPTGKKKEIAINREKFHHCPNPRCSHILTSREIRTMQCSRCKAQ